MPGLTVTRGPARTRFASLGERLELVPAPLECCAFPPGSFDPLYAGLLFEHVDPAPALERCARWLASGGCLAVVLQLPSPSAPPVTSTAIPSILALAETMRLVAPEELIRLAAANGLRLERSREVPVKNGKRFWIGELLGSR